MKLVFLFSLCLYLSRPIHSQDLNLIIQVNNELITDGISGVYLKIGSTESSEQHFVSYFPGRLKIDSSLWKEIVSDTSKKVTLYFDYATFDKNHQLTANFFADFKWYHFKQPYLILNIYDFRDKKYKHWYKWLTEKEFLAEFRYPNGPVYIRQR